MAFAVETGANHGDVLFASLCTGEHLNTGFAAPGITPQGAHTSSPGKYDACGVLSDPSTKNVCTT